MRPSRRHILGLAVLVLLTAIVGCDTMVQDEEQPPELIPSQAFTVQTELFNQRRSGKATIDPHFMAAVMRVWPVSTTLESRLYLPARLTRAALNETPSIEGDAWVWEATTSVDGESLAFTLTGRPMGSEVDWTLEIIETTPHASTTAPRANSDAPIEEAPIAPAATAPDTSRRTNTMASHPPASDPPPSAPDSAATDSTTYASQPVASPSVAPSDDGLQQEVQALTKADSSFVLYTAETARDGKQGRWRLYDTVGGERTHVLNGTFEIEKTNKMELSLTVPPSASEHGGDSIVYAQDDDQRRLRWIRAREGQTHRIAWNVRNYKGSITATNYNGGQAACWGKQLNNVDCSE